MERPNRVSAKYSGGWKLSATLASSGAAMMKISSENMPPDTELTAAMPSARPASPFCANG